MAFTCPEAATGFHVVFRLPLAFTAPRAALDEPLTVLK